MKNNKIPGNDGLTKNFYKTFRDELKHLLIESIDRAFYSKILSILQRQAVNKLIEKKECDKRYIKILETNLIFNCQDRNLSKAISNKLKALLPTLISSQQTAYIKNKFIGESRSLISDVIEIMIGLILKGF